MTILHLKEGIKKRILTGLSTQKANTEIRFLDMASTWSTLENNKGIGREVRVKEPMLAIDKPLPSPIITLLEAVCHAPQSPA